MFICMLQTLLTSIHPLTDLNDMIYVEKWPNCMDFRSTTLHPNLQYCQKALHSSNNIISLHWSLLWMFSAPNYATSENWVPNNVPESCKMLRRLSTILLNALNFETIWSISSLTKLVNYVSLPFSNNIQFAVAALRFISYFCFRC